jgi:hypothetical protein
VKISSVVALLSTLAIPNSSSAISSSLVLNKPSSLEKEIK